MYKRVLVTLDGSPTSEAVLQEVARLEPGSKVTLLIVADEPRATAEPPRAPFTGGAPTPGGIVRVPGPRVMETRDQAYGHAREELSAYLEERAGPFRSAGLEVSAEVRFGDAAEEILAAAKELNVELIMMATHGHSALVQVVFGSVASRVVGSGVRPVLLVRPRELRSQKS
ncbi:MAG TPA: universal stress protein [Dehalococcoidia bacterium]|nr:universal stress protein [Dehalococcoidia bacterium]